MDTKLVLISSIAVVVIIGLITASVTFNDFENLKVERTHGTVSTQTGSSILGSPSAQITIIEFGDYQCHQCYNWFHNTKPSIFENYVDDGKVNFIFVDLAFLGRDSLKAAQASYCAEDQGKYWEYHNQLYELQEPQIDNGWANSERLKAFAFNLDLDQDMFDKCLDSGKYAKRVQDNIQEAKKIGATGTPTFLIVGPDGQQEKLSGAQPYVVFKQLIDSII